MTKVINEAPDVVPIDSVTPHPENPRRGDLEEIRALIREHGFYGALVVQRSTGHILAGNHRWRAARQEGLESIPVVYIDVDDDRARRILLADNRSSDLGGYDDEALVALLTDLREPNGDGLHGTGYASDDLERLLREIDQPSPGQTDPDKVPEAAEPVTEPGDVWVLGRHRLLCGDATDPEDVERLLHGACPALMVIDPPYGVEYDPEWRARAGVNKNRGKMGVVQGDERCNWSDAWRLFPGDVAYTFAPGGANVIDHGQALVAAGFDLRYMVIWVKDRPVLGRGHYHWKHEPCWYAVRSGGNARWVGGRSQNTVWEVPARDDSGHGHGTQKPVEVMARPMWNHAADVYDPFVGSGTALIAAERTRRTCYAMDIDPRYVDVAVRRWEDYTGQEAERL